MTTGWRRGHPGSATGPSSLLSAGSRVAPALSAFPGCGAAAAVAT
jgi:hypothetical protein